MKARTNRWLKGRKKIGRWKMRIILQVLRKEGDIGAIKNFIAAGKTCYKKNYF